MEIIAITESLTLESITSNDYEKYYPNLSMKLQIWSWIQYTLVFCFMMYFINNLYRISFVEGIQYAVFLYVSIMV